ncbi:MAG: acyl-CoA thioesterase [Bacteroidota bacterium]
MPKVLHHSLLEEYPVITARAVNWRDIDPAMHVGNTKYMEWAEMGRIDYFQHYALLTSDRNPQGIGPVIASIKCRYLAPLNFPDEVLIGTRMIDIGHYLYVLEGCVVSKKQNKVAALAKARMVLFDFAKNEKVALPLNFKEKVAHFEAESLNTRNLSLKE